MLLTIARILSPEALHEVHQLLGQARWQDGRATAGTQAVQVKNNDQLPPGDDVVRPLQALVLQALEKHPMFFSATLPKRVLPPLFNRYAGAHNSYGNHVDQAVRYVPGGGQRVRTDISCTLFLCDPASYDGGELVVQDTFGEQRVKLQAGDLVLYPGTSVHRVEPVTRGQRLASFFWIESMVRSDEQRRLLYEMDLSLMRLREAHGDSEATVQLTGTYHNLLRMWADTSSARPPPLLEALPAGVVNLADFEAAARPRVDAAAWAYLNGGAADELTLQDNLAAWRRLRLLPRVLRPLGGGHTRVSLLGRTLAHPVLLAPVAYQRLFHHDGEWAVAHAAAAQGAGLVLSAQSSTELEAVAQPFADEPGSGPLWFQLYWRDDRDFMQALVQRVARAGYQALVLTVDAPVHGARDSERRAGFQRPAHIRAVNLGGLKRPLQLQAGQSVLFDGLMPRAATWDEVDWLLAHSRLPLLLKGVTHPDDARQALARGVSGLVVSNHGGRTLDTLPPTAELLPLLRRALGPEATLLVDGGIRRGTDVLKALALGANAVLLGRPYVHALAAAGALGVAHALRLLRDELEIAMALSGCKTLAEASPALLWPPAP